MGYVTKKFAKRLREIRETTGMTQTQFANELGVSRGAISYYENGDRTPDIEFIDKLYEYFNCTLPVEFILGYTDNVKIEHKNMYDYYGLTDTACDELERDTKVGNLISVILGHNNFHSVKRLYKNIIRNYKDFDYTKLGYLSFLISDSLNHIVYNSLEVLLDIQFTKEEREALRIEHEKHMLEYATAQKELEIKQKEREERWKQEEEEFKQKDAEENAIRYSAIDKIHEKFIVDGGVIHAEFRRYNQ